VRVQTYGVSAGKPDQAFAVTLVEPGAPWRAPRIISAPRYPNTAWHQAPYADATFAQPDPNDPSHFWFDFTVNTRRFVQPYTGTVDAWLNDDDTVTFKLRGPAATRNP
jgi:hypothetical protein